MQGCAWAQKDSMMQRYHDQEWGVAEYDSRALWEKLMLDGFQAGLSWQTILRKRDAFRLAFAGFEPSVVMHFTDADTERLLQNTQIVRSRAKIAAVIRGAGIYMDMLNNGEDFSAYVWGMAGGVPLLGDGHAVPTQTDLSVRISKDLKKRGFSFVGPVIVYAWMQACGIVNDHAHDCPRRNKKA